MEVSEILIIESEISVLLAKWVRMGSRDYGKAVELLKVKADEAAKRLMDEANERVKPFPKEE